ncbi:ligand-binding sensor domain-containing protein [Gelidibacter salicanalis]|uniref:Two component regulator three Y domain-containing protein n=1 Tax=Gelidibacter salicanalis TaxID=291193 RepID=A0A934NKB6_9FLAO|nr:two-component regulator propeller domain-containing protein [Gelidibacter salicanalis]MBJ7879827.1 hypothetical protein [Gelidibacter salicanalis]
MKNIRLFIIFLISCLNFSFVYAQEYVLRFQNITSKQGLSDNRINDVIQDSNGLIWAGNKLAINKYNGEKTESYEIENGGVVTKLIQAKTGTILAATTKGIFVYNADKNRFIGLTSDDKNFNDLLKGNIWKLIQSREDDTFWFINGSTLGGFKINDNFDIDVKTQNIITNDSSSSYSTLVEDTKHVIWLGNTRGDIFKYRPKSSKTVELFRALTKVAINDILADNTNKLWVATNGQGLFHIDPDNGSLVHFLNHHRNNQTVNSNIVLSLFLDQKNNLWIGTDGGGLNLFQHKTNTFHFFKQGFDNDYSISDNSILSISQGLDKTILVSTVHGGISIFKNHLDIKRISAEALGFNYKDGQSSTILEDSDKNIWLSAGRDGLRKYNPNTQQLTSFIDNPKDPTDFSGSIVLSLMEDKQKRIWIGTLRGGLNIYDIKNKRFIVNLPHNDSQRIYAIEEAKNGDIWIGSSDGIKIYDVNLNLIDKIQVSLKNSSGNNVTAIYKDVKDDMWVGTENGLHQYQITSSGYNKQSYYSNPQDSVSLSSNHILSIAETENLSLLIGTYGDRVNIYSRTRNTFQKLKTKNNIDGAIIRGILKDKNHNIWLSTNTGLSKINTDGSVINLTSTEGVQAFNGGSAQLDSKGSILMAGSQGLTYFHPKELQPNSPLPKVFFTSASIVNNQESSDSINYHLSLNKAVINTPIELSHNTVLFAINFSSSYLYAPDELTYAYKLDGLNDTWQPIENTKSLTFSSLNPGDYTLKIKVANDLGAWSPYIASLKIKVTPSLWQKKSTKAIIFLTLLTLLIVIYKWRIASIKSQKEKLQYKLKLKTNEVKKQQDEVYQGKIAVLDAEKKNQKLNQKKLKDELKFKINELTNHTLRTIHKNNLLNDIREKLKQEIKLAKIDKQNLRNLINLIDDSFILDKDWESFYAIFNQVHPTFFDDLKTFCPKLSERDIQLCALIKLNFSSEHIAILYGISLSSVKVARHRLRKKLGVKEGQPLKDFLSDINVIEDV